MSRMPVNGAAGYADHVSEGVFLTQRALDRWDRRFAFATSLRNSMRCYFEAERMRVTRRPHSVSIDTRPSDEDDGAGLQVSAPTKPDSPFDMRDLRRHVKSADARLFIERYGAHKGKLDDFLARANAGKPQFFTRCCSIIGIRGKERVAALREEIRRALSVVMGVT